MKKRQQTNLKAVANDPKTPTHLLVELSKSDNPELSFAVAFNPSTPRDVRNQLMMKQNFGDFRTFAELAKQAQTLEALLYFLAHIERNGVRAALAENENTPSWMLKELYELGIKYDEEDEEEYMLLRALAVNTNTPAETLADIFRDIENTPEVYCCLACDLAQNPNVTSETLVSLANLAQDEFDSSEEEEWEETLYYILRNPNATAELQQSIKDFFTD